MTADEKPAPFETWAIVELMGHVRLAGRLTEESRFGATLGRVDIPIGDQGDMVTQYFGGGSVYRITPTDEETARQVARYARPQPIYRLALTAGNTHDDDDDDDYGDDE